MKIGILLFEQFHGKQNIGSSRIRGHWLAKHWSHIPEGAVDLSPAKAAVAESECEIYKMGQKYDVIIYQKVYWIEHAEKFQGIKILDMCDPDFLHWGTRMKQMINACDAVTTSTQVLADFVKQYTDKPVIYIPDRMDLESFGTLKKDHHGKGRASKVAWFGYSENFPMLDQAIGTVLREKLDELMVIANPKMPYQLPSVAKNKILLTNIAWGEYTVNIDLLMADIVLNPQSALGKWKFKSNNKTIQAWALGLPVAHLDTELHAFMDETARIEEGNKRYAEVREKYDVRLSVAEMKSLIAKLYENKTKTQNTI